MILVGLPTCVEAPLEPTHPTLIRVYCFSSSVVPAYLTPKQ